MGKIDPNELPRCAVKGLVAPRAMCACVVMGGRCGTKGPCQHKLDPKPAEPVNARMLEALKHILNGSLSLPRFAEEQARAAIAAAETRQAEPAGSLTLDKGEVEFLAARVRRLLAKFGVHEPEKDSRFIVGVAGSLIGNLLTNIELKEKAGMVRLSGDDQPAPAIIEGAPCRNALARDGKPYPKSSCQRCGTLLRSGWKCANGVEI